MAGPEKYKGNILGSSLSTIGGGSPENSGGGGGNSFTNLLSGVMGSTTPLGYIGPAVNILTGLLDKGAVRDAPEVDRSGLDLMPDTFNIEPQLEQNTSDFLAASNSISNNMVGPGASSSINSLYSNKLAANSKLFGAKFNEENRMMADKASMSAKYDAIDQNAKMQHYGMQVRNDSNVGATGNFVRAGIDDLSTTAQFNVAQKNQMNTDLFTAGLMSKAYSGKTGIDDRLTVMLEEYFKNL